jgi:SET domain-containing protein
VSEQIEVRSSGIAGQGLFARNDIPAGVVVSRLGGRIVSDDDLGKLVKSASSSYVDSVSIAEDGNLVLPPGTANHYGNHGCDPSLWWTDPFSLTTRSHLAAGEELTVDYGTLTDDPDFRMCCRCGATCCRGVVSGADWMRTDLQEKYGDHWVPVLREKVRSWGLA